MRNRTAFTIIELLVVITIIVVLLALLTPAMDRAIYQAELTVCGANLRAIASGVQTYAMGERRFYPYRRTVQNSGQRPPQLNWSANNWDDRPLLKTCISINKNLLDPFSQPVNFETAGGPVIKTEVFAGYELWFSWRYSMAGGGKGMYKLGDRFEWLDNRYAILASDLDSRNTGDYVQSCHPDADGLLTSQSSEDFMDVQGGSTFAWTLSLWANTGAVRKRGLIDRNIAFDDGSVPRYDQVEYAGADERMIEVPHRANVTTPSLGYLPQSR